eukprot:650237_1
MNRSTATCVVVESTPTLRTKYSMQITMESGRKMCQTMNQKLSKVNDVDAITIRIAPTVSVSDPKATHTILLELTACTIKGPDLWDICAVLNVSGSMCSSAAVQEEDKQCLAIRRG